MIAAYVPCHATDSLSAMYRAMYPGSFSTHLDTTMHLEVPKSQMDLFFFLILWQTVINEIGTGLKRFGPLKQ